MPVPFHPVHRGSRCAGPPPKPEHPTKLAVLVGEGQPPAPATASLPTAWPASITRCAPACVLWFYDTTRNGTRRWCSMAICGNGAKAHRHYDRVKKTR